MYKTIAAATTAVLIAGAASAVPLSGTFTIDIYQRLDATYLEAHATEANLAAPDTVLLETISYTGSLWFGTYDPTDATTIGEWLSTSPDGVYSVSAATGALQLSSPDIDAGTSTTTFFDIVGTFTDGFTLLVDHDDGMTAFDDGVQIASHAGPTTVITTPVNGFDGGEFRMIYAASNGDPSVLMVDAQSTVIDTVPLPAGLPLLLTGFAGLALLRRRRG